VFTIPSISSVQPNKVYIGGLPENTREEDLQNCFGKIGKITMIELKCVWLFSLLQPVLLTIFPESVMASS